MGDAEPRGLGRQQRRVGVDDLVAAVVIGEQRLRRVGVRPDEGEPLAGGGERQRAARVLPARTISSLMKPVLEERGTGGMERSAYSRTIDWTAARRATSLDLALSTASAPSRTSG